MDQINETRQALKALAASNSGRAMDVCRELWPEIREALDSGAKRRDVVKLLENRGYNITLAAFDSSVRRLRAEDAGNSTSTKS